MKNKRGFSLIELMATTIILGLIMVIALVSVNNHRQKEAKLYYNSQENMIILAAKDYYSRNVVLLPKEVGVTAKIPLATLINQDFVKPVKDYKKESCSAESLKDTNVYVTKINQEEYNYSINFNCNSYQEDVDTTKPSVTFNPKNSVKARTLDIEISIFDSSKIKFISYKINNENEVIKDITKNKFKVTLDKDGEFQIKVKAIDENNNITEEISPKYMIDKTKTLQPVLINPISGYTNKGINISVVSAIDAAKTECKTSNTQYTPCNIKFLVENNTTVYARSYDKVGNVSDETSLVVNNIDKRPPSIDFYLYSDSKSQKIVNVSINDYESKVASYRYKISTNGGYNWGSWSSYSSGTNEYIYLTQAGDNQIYLEATDNAGNINSNYSSIYTINNSLGYLKGGDDIYIQYGGHLFVTYDTVYDSGRTGYKAVLNGVYDQTTYSSTACCDTGVCNYENNNFTNNKIGSVLRKFLNTLPSSYNRNLIYATWNSGYNIIDDNSNIIANHEDARTATSYVGLMNVGELNSIASNYSKYHRVLDPVERIIYWLSTLTYYKGNVFGEAAYYRSPDGNYILYKRTNENYISYPSYNIGGSTYARPVVVFDANAQVEYGSGTKYDPFVIY